jgi:purine-binding chemotaxis protein CheW
MATQDRHRPDRQRGFVGFVVGDVTYAVSIANVREIVNPSPLTELPHAPPAVAGVLDHRGEVVPIVDLRARFGLSPGAGSRRTKWILIEVEGRSVGLTVDRVTGVFGVSDELRPPPTLGPGDEARGIVGVAPYGGGLVFVLDVGRFDVLTHSLRPDALLALRSRAGGEA